MLASIVIRTLNEARHLEDLLKAIAGQQTGKDLTMETIVIDSGSEDGTLAIAANYACRVLHIKREEFSFGRSLNHACAAARGEILVMVSGHCVPTGAAWLQALCQPIIDGSAAYSYGRQLGGLASRYSECRIFAKYFPEQSAIPQEGYYCNNANAALAKSAWETHRFDEDLTGLEDMDLAKRLVAAGGKVAYVAESCVYHHHYEQWASVQRRFERESIALRHIMPQVHIRKRDLLRYVLSSIYLDSQAARQEGVWARKLAEIITYRLRQYWGSFKGNHEHRRLSNTQKDRYFYPN